MKKSTLCDLYTEGVEYEIVNDASVPRVFTQVEQEYQVFRQGVALVDGIGYAMLKIEGENAIEEMDALVTKDIRYLNPGKISECLFLNEEAQALGLAYVLNDDNTVVVLVPPENAQRVTAWIYEKLGNTLQITDMTATEQLLFVEGEKSWKIIKDTFAFAVETLPLREMVRIEHEGETLMLSRIGRSGEYGYAMIGEFALLHKIAEYLLKTYGDQNLAWCGTAAMDICMLEVNQPVIGRVSAQQGNLLELAYQWFVQYEKEAYCGREILMEQFAEKLKKGCVGFVADGVSAVTDGAPVYLEDEQVGCVLYSSYDPALKGVLGYLLLETRVAVSGIPLTIRDGEGDVQARTVSSPFVRPLSWDSSME